MDSFAYFFNENIAKVAINRSNSMFGKNKDGLNSNRAD